MKLFEDKKSLSKFSNWPSSVGRVPLKILLTSHNSLKLLRLPNSVGRDPIKLFPFKTKYSKFSINPISVGMLLEKFLSPRYNTVIICKLEMDMGMGPES